MYMYMSSSASDLQCLCSVQQIRQVKVHNVVSSDDVRVHFLDKVTPFLEEKEDEELKTMKVNIFILWLQFHSILITCNILLSSLSQNSLL